VHAVALLPLALLASDAARRQLGENPLQALTQRTGLLALALLFAALAVTPLVTVSGWRELQPHRRTVGLYAFLYATLHVATFAWLDYNLDLAQIAADVGEKRYVLAGLGTFVILAALAATSSRAAQRRLGRRWARLHRWVYVAAPLAVLHYAWAVKSDLRAPLACAVLVAVLLALRWPPVRRRAGALRQRVRPASPGPT
jgi:sulfoxide reductase heme-binding subunit YedZ